MAIQIQLRSGTTTQHNTFKGAVGEVTVDTDKDVLVVHDGVTAGGFPVAARANADGTISLIKKDGTVIGTINSTGLFNNTLTSTNTDQALTAAQGKALKDSLNTVTSSSFGVGQTWQDLTSSRVLNTIYTNSTGKPICIAVNTNTDDNNMSLYINEVLVTFVGSTPSSSGDSYHTITGIIPAGSTYRVTVSSGSISKWSELR